LERKLGAKRETIQNQNPRHKRNKKRKKERGWLFPMVDPSKKKKKKFSRLDNVGPGLSFFFVSLSLSLRCANATGREDCLLSLKSLLLYLFLF
jgi:hypothetical protein